MLVPGALHDPVVDLPGYDGGTTPDPEPQRDLEWFMYSPEGNEAVADAVELISKEAEEGRFTSKETLAERARVLVKGVAADYPEVYDTEPRGAISDHLDAHARLPVVQ